MVGFNWLASGLFWACKWTLKIQFISLFWIFLGHFKAKSATNWPTNLVFLAKHKCKYATIPKHILIQIQKQMINFILWDYG